MKNLIFSEKHAQEGANLTLFRSDSRALPPSLKLLLLSCVFFILWNSNLVAQVGDLHEVGDGDKEGCFDWHANERLTCNGFVVDFTGGSNAETNIWDFGDGSTSLLPQPTHTYLQAGTYSVNLIASNNCNSDTIQQFVSVVASAISEINSHENCIKVNSQSEIEIRCGLWETLSIYDVSGRKMGATDLVKNSLQLYKDRLESGIYVLIFSSSDGNNHAVKWRNY